jgi:hypothetical protein
MIKVLLIKQDGSLQKKTKSFEFGKLLARIIREGADFGSTAR